MRVFAVSDLHVDYAQNRAWVHDLSRVDYQQDVLLTAGDLSHEPERVTDAMTALRRRFARVLFVPGNHDLWVRSTDPYDSLERHAALRDTLRDLGVDQDPFVLRGTEFVPLLGWYDFSFGTPGTRLKQVWMDFRRCRWPSGWEPADIDRAFSELNSKPIGADSTVKRRVTVSHFLPRPDVLPMPAIMSYGWILPVLGSWRLEQQLRSWARDQTPQIHIYGHSHVRVDRVLNGIRYINNARGTPNEPRYSPHRLKELKF